MPVFSDTPVPPHYLQKYQVLLYKVVVWWAGGPASSTNNSSLQRGWGRTWSRCQQKRDQRGSCFKCRNWLIHIWWKTMLWNAPKHTHAYYCFFSSDTSLDTKKGLQPTYFESRYIQCFKLSRCKAEKILVQVISRSIRWNFNIWVPISNLLCGHLK